VEVEFVMANVSTGALLTLHASDMLPVAGTDIATVRTTTKRFA
jgi:hypothetical protein